MSVKHKFSVTSLENSYVKEQEMAARTMAKRRKLLFRRLTVFLVLTVAVAALLISTLITRENALQAKNAEKIKLEETLASLEKEQQLLENEVVKLNDDEYIAKIARSEYFLSDEGEIIFNIPEPKQEKKEK